MRLLQERELSKPDDAAAAAAAPGLAQQMRDRASELVLTAINFLGVPYRRGGNGGSEAGLDDNGAGGFDCSGFTRQIFKMSLGRLLPRRADDQATSAGLLSVRRDELRTGDLVFFNTLRRTFSHVGIYIGDGRFIHSPSAGGQVRIEDMGFWYWRDRFTGARRVDASDPAPAAEPLPAAMTHR